MILGAGADAQGVRHVEGPVNALLAAYARATGDDQQGAVMLGDQMIDEASRKMASVTVERGRAAGLRPSPQG